MTAANNLFYGCDMWFGPADSGGANWMFIDNIFDNASLHGSPTVAQNNHNAYIGMSYMTVPRLLPATQTGTDKILPSLVYDTGPLGRFYRSGQNELWGQGSRTAGAAGL